MQITEILEKVASSSSNFASVLSDDILNATSEKLASLSEMMEKEGVLTDFLAKVLKSGLPKETVEGIMGRVGKANLGNTLAKQTSQYASKGAPSAAKAMGGTVAETAAKSLDSVAAQRAIRNANATKIRAPISTPPTIKKSPTSNIDDILNKNNKSSVPNVSYGNGGYTNLNRFKV